MSPKQSLDGRIYTVTAGRILNTNAFQINLGKLLFRATLKVRLGSCLSTALKMDNLDCNRINAHLKKFTAYLQEGAHSCTLLARPLPLMSVNDSQLCSTHSHC